MEQGFVACAAVNRVEVGNAIPSELSRLLIDCRRAMARFKLMTTTGIVVGRTEQQFQFGKTSAFDAVDGSSTGA